MKHKQKRVQALFLNNLNKDSHYLQVSTYFKDQIISEYFFLPAKKDWQISALAPTDSVVQSGQIKKIKALSYANYGLFNVIKCIHFFDHSLESRAEIRQNLGTILMVKMLSMYLPVINFNFLV